MNTSDTPTTDSPSRPFGYWLKAVDRLMAAEFAAAFDGEHTSRRDWRLLNVVDGTAPARRPLTAHKLHSLVERGWVVADGDTWTLTDEGRAAKDRLGTIVDGIRAKVSDAVPAEDLATTIATLEQIARAFGWDEETPLPRGRGRRHGFGRRRGFGHGFRAFGRGHGGGVGPGFHPGFGPGIPNGFGADADDCGHRGHPGHDRAAHDHDSHDGHHHGDRRHGHHGHGHRAARAAQRAYERGFDAGYSRGRDA